MTSTSGQPQGAANASSSYGTAAAPPLDMWAVVRDMAEEHVARLAADCSVLRVERDAAESKARTLATQLNAALSDNSALFSQFQELQQIYDVQVQENDVLREQLATARKATRKPARSRGN